MSRLSNVPDAISPGKRGDISSIIVPRIESPNIFWKCEIGKSKLGLPANETGVLGDNLTSRLIGDYQIHDER